MGNLLQDNKQAVISLLALWGLLIVLFLGGSNIYKRIGDVRGKMKQGQSQLNQLESKLAILNEAQTRSISESARDAAEALPASNPAMPLLLQITRLVNDNSLAIITITLAGADSDSLGGINQISLDVTLQGSVSDINNFLSGLETVKPMTNLRALSFRHLFGDETVRAELTVSTFWSDLPTELPAVSDSISGLTQSELATIDTVKFYTSPTFTELGGLDLAPTIGNPFSFR